MLDDASESRLVQLLIERGLANDSQIAQGLIVQEESGATLGGVLVEMGVLGERDLVGVLGIVHSMPVVDLRRDNPEPEAVALVPEDVTRRYLVVPLALGEGEAPRRRR